MKGLARALNSFASQEARRAVPKVHSHTSDPHRWEKYHDKRFAPKSVHLDRAKLVDLSPDQLMMESVEELTYLMGDIHADHIDAVIQTGWKLNMKNQIWLIEAKTGVRKSIKAID